MSDDVDEAKPAKQQEMPSLEEARSSVQNIGNNSRRLQEEFEAEFTERSIASELKYTHLAGLQDHYRHKSKWSWFLMVLMLWMIAFQSLVIWKVGANKWDFSQYDWLPPALLAQNLAQIVGLAVFVVKSLFTSLSNAWD